jgi:hypothetical protein
MDFKLDTTTLLKIKSIGRTLTVLQYSDGDVAICDADDDSGPDQHIWIVGVDELKEVISALQKCVPLAEKQYKE